MPVVERYHKVDKLISNLSKVNPRLANEVYEVLIDALSIMVERNVTMGYKESYAVAGLQGVIFHILHKAERLKNSLISEESLGFSLTGSKILKDSVKFNGSADTDPKLNSDEGPYAHILDCFNYCLLAMTLFHRYMENIDGKNK